MDINLDAPTLVSAVSGVGATNWLLDHQFGFNIITELLGSSPELGYLAFGAAGILSLTELFGVTEVLD